MTHPLLTASFPAPTFRGAGVQPGFSPILLVSQVHRPWCSTSEGPKDFGSLVWEVSTEIGGWLSVGASPWPYRLLLCELDGAMVGTLRVLREIGALSFQYLYFTLFFIN